MSQLIQTSVVELTDRPEEEAKPNIYERLAEWNATERKYPHVDGLQQLIEAPAAKSPKSIAVEFPQSLGKSVKLTYEELEQRSNQLAHQLQSLGVGPDIIVGICAERSLEMLVAVLAVIKAGGAYAALDPNYPRERLEFMVEDTKAPIILTQQHLLAALPKCKAVFISLDSDWDKIAKNPTTPLPCRVNHDHLAYLIYTSGST
jgi:non-ribosomal peptide synthetase component F